MPGRRRSEDDVPEPANNPTVPPKPEVDGDQPDLVRIGRLESALEERTQQREELAGRLKTTERILTEVQQSEGEMREELGRLREVASRVEVITQERVALQEHLDTLQVELPSRIEEQLATRLKEVTAAQAAEIEALQQDRDRLAARVAEMETPKVENATSMRTSALATHFADLLVKVAEVPAPSADAPYAASVTGFSVSAKGVLTATGDGDLELVTPEPGSVPADTLSTLHFEGKLMPRLGSKAPER